MSVLSLTCPTPGCYQNYPCDPEFQNKIIAVAYVKKSAALTPAEKANGADWMEALQQRYLDGEAYLIFNTSGDKPKPETATTTGRGMQNTKTLAKTHTLNYMDMQGITLVNVQWYCDMLASAQNYDFYYFTPNRIWDASGSYVTVIGDPVITAELNTYQQAEVVVTWVSKCNPLPYTFPTDTFNEGLFFNITQDPTGIPQTVFPGVCQTTELLDTDWTAELNQDGLIDGTLIWSLQAGESQIPAGLGIDDETGNLTLDEVDTGTYNLTVVVTNEAGCVFGSLDFSIEVVACGG